MKKFFVGVLALVAAVVLSHGQVYAQSVPFDYAVTKTVKVGNGSFVDANTEAAAAQGHVGDTVTWRITVSLTVSSESPNLYLRDLIPDGFTIVSVTSPDDFDVDQSTWRISFVSSDEPKTFDVVTTADQLGSFENVAELGRLFQGEVEEDPAFFGTGIDDDNAANNQDNAWVQIVPVPTPTPTPTPVTVVLGASTTPTPTLSDTGSNALLSFVLLGMIAAATLILGKVTQD